jgi:hypothetical protein
LFFTIFFANAFIFLYQQTMHFNLLYTTALVWLPKNLTYAQAVFEPWSSVTEAHEMSTAPRRHPGQAIFFTFFRSILQLMQKLTM